jgi:hypothetical protein
MKRLAVVVAAVACLGFASTVMAAPRGGPQGYGGHGPSPGYQSQGRHGGYHGQGGHGGYYGQRPHGGNYGYGGHYRPTPYRSSGYGTYPAPSYGRPYPPRPYPSYGYGRSSNCGGGGVRVGGPGWGVSVGW